MSAIVRQINSVGWYRILIVFLLIWLVILFFTAFPLLGTHIGQTDDSKTYEKLSRALNDLEALRKQNLELQEIFKDINLNSLQGEQKEAIENFQYRLIKAEHPFTKSPQLGYISPKEEPNLEYELLRRRIASNINEFWYFIHSGLVDLLKKSQGAEMTDSIQYLLDMGAQHKRSLTHDAAEIAEVDGYATWREKEANDLSELVQKRFAFLQNPADCSTAKKLVCNLNKGCGYGCQLHHAAYCFMMAYGTKRTMILKSVGWRYHKRGWEEIFKPISENCLSDEGESFGNWPGHPDTQVILLPIIDSLPSKKTFLPLAIPEDLAPRLTRLHGDPFVWWIGQILKYFLRAQPRTADSIQETMTKMGFKRPIVGVHVRRTDKVGTEAAFHALDEYMTHVEEYYKLLALKEPVEKKRIFLATDDPSVIFAARKNYPEYEVLGDPNISKTASTSRRYSDVSLFGIINDIHMLAMSDYLVCTFSSQVCRMAYEIMQIYYPDASARFRSLDDVYYYGGQNAHNVEAVLAHEPLSPKEISVVAGDLIGIAGNHWNGFSKGRNLRTNQLGLYPSFKVKDVVVTAKYPNYSEINKGGNDADDNK